ncbi:MAG: ribonuclease III [Gammaproteobacteria bacterium]|nr:ribonuclease III [Gammaproteobacteria bacterium]
MATALDKLQKHLNYQFSDQELVRTALTHRSANRPNNERLEFLGDSLLGFIVAEILFEIYPDAREGDLSRMRAGLVNKESLAEFARELELGECLRLGLGELNTGGKDRDSILADTVEAIIAAIYLDGGIEACRQFVRRWSEARLSSQFADAQQKDNKTRLQELMQSQGLPLPRYEVVKISGEDHQQLFQVSCRVAPLQKFQIGHGRSKRFAEQEAAQKALEQLGEN